MVTQSRVKDLLDYNETTGELINKARRQGIVVGTIAGTTNTSDGYRHITIDYKIYAAHRLVWLYIHGELPEFLDHKDSNRLNNKLSNLRVATKSTNNCNQLLTSRNTSGVKGLTWYNDKNYYYARVRLKGKTTCKAFPVKYGIDKQQALTLATEWVRAKRLELHGDFVNHG